MNETITFRLPSAEKRLLMSYCRKTDRRASEVMRSFIRSLKYRDTEEQNSNTLTRQ